MNICCADQDQRLRDSTDFETQLYLCNEAFKVFSSTLSKLQQNFKISHIHIHKSYSQFKTLKLEHFMELCNESGKRKQNWRIQPKYYFLSQQMIFISTVARLEHLPPTLLLLGLALVPPLCPHRHPCPPPIHPGKVEGANTSGYGRSFVIRMDCQSCFPGAEWNATSNNSHESELCT